MSEHRWIWEQAHGPIPEGMHVHHLNGDPRDNRLVNLVLMTPGNHSAHHNQKHPITKPCAQCGEDFAPHPTKRARAVTCSPTCFRAWMSAVTRSRRWSAKLTIGQYREIRDLIAAGMMQKEIAARYGVAPSSITRIKQMTA